MGYEIPASKPTKWAYFYMLKYIGLPVCLILTGIDIIMYFLLKYAFDSCYGLFCLIN